MRSQSIGHPTSSSMARVHNIHVHVQYMYKIDQDSINVTRDIEYACLYLAIQLQPPREFSGNHH